MMILKPYPLSRTNLSLKKTRKSVQLTLYTKGSVPIYPMYRYLQDCLRIDSKQQLAEQLPDPVHTWRKYSNIQISVRVTPSKLSLILLINNNNNKLTLI